MSADAIRYIDLTHLSPEFDAAYDVLSQNISPEFLETREFLKNRFRVRDTGPDTGPEKILVQDNYTLHLIAAVQDNKVVGAIYGHLIADIEPDKRGIGFVTYIGVSHGHRRQGIGTKLIHALKERVEEDALRITRKPIIGMVYEIEGQGKEAIKACVNKHAWPLDVVYYQPALRSGYAPERMDLWFQSCEPTVTTREAANTFRLSAVVVISMVRNMLVKEYVGPEVRGFDLASTPYVEFINSVGKRKEIGWRNSERF